MTILRTLALSGTATAFAGAAAAHIWARHIEIHRYTLRTVDVPVLPAGSSPLTVLHISDIHLLPSQERKLAFLRTLAELAPDLVINTGDNISSADAVEPLLEALDPLLRRPGAFVMGSNDLFAPHRKNPLRYFLPDPRVKGMTTRTDVDLPTDDLRAGLAQYGWKDLDNTRARLALPDLRIEFAGVDDPHLDRDVMPAPDTDTPSSRTRNTQNTPASHPVPAEDHSSLPSKNDEPTATLRLGVAHAPYQRVLNAFVDDGADAIFAGHTHGGQLRIPGIGALVTNCDLPRRQAKGLSTWRGIPLHVSAGMGASPYSNYRFANPPEATLLTLRPQKG